MDFGQSNYCNPEIVDASDYHVRPLLTTCIVENDLSRFEWFYDRANFFSYPHDDT